MAVDPDDIKAAAEIDSRIAARKKDEFNAALKRDRKRRTNAEIEMAYALAMKERREAISSAEQKRAQADRNQI